jgi:Fe-S cluster assembly protein SufD
MIDVQEDKSGYVAEFSRLRPERAANGQSWLAPVRKAGIARFEELGFPTTEHEDWRFTNVGAIAGTDFRPANGDRPAVEPGLLKAFTFGADEGWCLVFVNGVFAPELSIIGGRPGGVHIGSLSAAVAQDRQLVRRHLTRYAGFQNEAFVALNTAFLSDGAFVHIPKGTALKTPVHVLYLTVPEAEPIVTHPRNLILVDEGSQATVVESYASADGGIHFTNGVTELVVGENAAVDHYKVQRESRQAYHVATLQIHQERNSNVSSHSVSLGGDLVRNNIGVVLDGEGCECMLNGLYAAGGRQHMDNYLRVVHAKAHCSSREYFKGILDDRASGVFTGRIVVRPGAQKTDAKQTNKNLLLSSEARIDTKPQLEIFADDVKCTHGATIGQIDSEALFYLRSRGIHEEAARSLLIHAFAGESLERIRIEAIRRRIEGQLLERLPGGEVLQASGPHPNGLNREAP